MLTLSWIWNEGGAAHTTDAPVGSHTAEEPEATAPPGSALALSRPSAPARPAPCSSAALRPRPRPRPCVPVGSREAPPSLRHVPLRGLPPLWTAVRGARQRWPPALACGAHGRPQLAQLCAGCVPQRVRPIGSPAGITGPPGPVLTSEQRQEARVVLRGGGRGLVQGGGEQLHSRRQKRRGGGQASLRWVGGPGDRAGHHRCSREPQRRRGKLAVSSGLSEDVLRTRCVFWRQRPRGCTRVRGVWGRRSRRVCGGRAHADPCVSLSPSVDVRRSPLCLERPGGACCAHSSGQRSRRGAEPGGLVGLASAPCSRQPAGQGFVISLRISVTVL